MGDLTWIIILAVAWLVLKLGGARLTMLLLGKDGLARVGRASIAAQPDRLTLAPADGSWRSSPAVRAIVEPLLRAGFGVPRSYGVAELPGLVLHLACQPKDQVVLAAYEHPKAGVWFDLVSRYADGGSITFSTAPMGGGLDQRPGHATHHLPGTAPAELLALLKAERAPGELVPVAEGTLAGMFEEAYAESMAWRKGHGISAEEVRRVGLERTTR